jgi:hypothetical protein
MTKEKTNSEKTRNDFNNIQPSINFTIEKEKQKNSNNLGIKIHLKGKQLEFSIHRKPAQTDIIIPKSSCHPYGHKLSSIKYLLNRLITYLITKKAKQMEINTIRNTLQNTEHKRNLLEKPL